LLKIQQPLKLEKKEVEIWNPCKSIYLMPIEFSYFKVFQEVSIGHPESSVVKRFRILLSTLQNFFHHLRRCDKVNLSFCPWQAFKAKLIISEKLVIIRLGREGLTGSRTSSWSRVSVTKKQVI
jgi:hypothetical protein